jgi:hypothetical protein
MAKKVVQNPVTPLKSIIIVHHFPDNKRKTNMKATSETKPTKRGKGRTRRRLALTAQDWEFVEKTAREQKVTAAEPAHACRQRTPGLRGGGPDRTSPSRLRALEARWDNLTVTREPVGGNGASALIPLKTIREDSSRRGWRAPGVAVMAAAAGLRVE